MTERDTPATPPASPTPVGESNKLETTIPNAARLSTKMRSVLEYMLENGCNVTTAARQTGMNIQAAQRAFRQPHVKKAYRSMLNDLRENAAQNAYLRNIKLAEKAESERLRFDANRWVAGVDGISPVTKVQGQHQHSHSFAGFEYGDIKDVTPDQHTQDVVPDSDD